VSGFRSASADPHDEAEEEVMRQRALRLRAPLARTDDTADLVWVASFQLGDDLFAFPLGVLRAAIPLKSVTPVPLAPVSVIGVLRFEGRLITAFSFAALLGQRSWQNDPTILLVLEPEPRELIAVDCSEVPISVALRAASIPERFDRAVARVTPERGPPIGLIHLPSLLASGKIGGPRA
jgi:chemotaxis signal transduction protein